MMRNSFAMLMMAGSLLAGLLCSAEPSRTFTGVITDTMCGAKPHMEMMKDKSEAECIRICAQGAYGYALFDGTTVLKLSDQKTPVKYAAQRVRVTGVYDAKNKTIKVTSIEPESGK